MKILENNSWDRTKLIGKLRCLPSVVYRYMAFPLFYFMILWESVN
jgi:hypothetical protein